MKAAETQLERIERGRGFIAALDQSGGSTPSALKRYGVSEDSYRSEAEMYNVVHAMRSRIMSNQSFGGDRIIGVILFEDTMERRVEDLPTPTYLWERKRIVPFVKVDKGLAEAEHDVQLMNPMPELDRLLKRAKTLGVAGTKMRSLIHGTDERGIATVVAQQFEYAERILDAGLVPIVEPEVSIDCRNKTETEGILYLLIQEQLDRLPSDRRIVLKLTLPDEANLYERFTRHPNVLRVVALSGGYSRAEANERLSQNRGVIASFSRALAEDLNVEQSDAEFSATLDRAIEGIYLASIT